MSVFHLAAIDFSLFFSILWTLLIFIQGKTIRRCRGMSKLCSSCFISCQTVIFLAGEHDGGPCVIFRVFSLMGACIKVWNSGRRFHPLRTSLYPVPTRPTHTVRWSHSILLPASHDSRRFLLIHIFPPLSHLQLPS